MRVRSPLSNSSPLTPLIVQRSLRTKRSVWTVVERNSVNWTGSPALMILSASFGVMVLAPSLLVCVFVVCLLYYTYRSFLGKLEGKKKKVSYARPMPKS